MTTIRATITMWTATTDGDNCPVTTTVHANEGDAIARVMNDMRGLDHNAKESLLNMSRDEVSQFWEERMDGGCIIERHVVTGELATSEEG